MPILKRADGWKFAGFDFDSIYEDQVNLLRSLNLKNVYLYNHQHDSNLLDPTSNWSLARSRQSEHFIVYWAKGYGDRDPNSPSLPANLRVDVDSLLEQAETYYNTVEKLGFLGLGNGRSQFTRKKQSFFLWYTDQYIAYSNQIDDVVGMSAISPSASRFPSAFAGTIFTSFLYLSNCELTDVYGFRSERGVRQARVFWLQSGRWLTQHNFPELIFRPDCFETYLRNCHRHFQHEKNFLSGCYLLYFWQQKRGSDLVARIWREALVSEDPIQAYMRITGLDHEGFNDELFEAAQHMVTWDIDSLRDKGQSKIGEFYYRAEKADNDFHRVTYEYCPGTTGYNIISLTVAPGSKRVKVEFHGIESHPNYSTPPAEREAGWRYGFVALNADGTRTYGESCRASTGSVEFEIRPTTKQLWFVVSGAPPTYRPHTWDEFDQNDEQWPYEIRVTGASLQIKDPPAGKCSDAAAY